MADTPLNFPTLTVRMEGSDGTKPAAPVMKPISLSIPTQLPRHIAKMYVVQYVAKELKRYGVDEALKAVGFK